MSPRVSVVVPAYNAEHCLQTCIDSVLRQTYVDWELVIIDDGSTDGTLELARNNRSDRVHCISQQNAGQGHARNAGLEVARGDYVTFLDADDEWRPMFLERTIDFLDTHSDVIAVSTAFTVRYQDGSEVDGPVSIAPLGPERAPVILDDFFSFWARHDHIRTGTAVIRLAAISSAGPQRGDLRVSQDLEYWGYIATFGKWAFIPEPLWIGNSRIAGATGGWLKKYRARRTACPAVESWGRRIEPRLSPSEMADFRVIEGRVAAGYCQYMILGGSRDKALHVVKTYGPNMPNNRLVRLLRTAALQGPLAWAAACILVEIKEYAKAIKFSLLARLTH